MLTQRDLEIMGQLALCDNDDQNVRSIINNNLAFFDDKFGGWSELVRKKLQNMTYQIPYSTWNALET